MTYTNKLYDKAEMNSTSFQIKELFENARIAIPEWKQENLGLGQSTII